MTPVHTASNTAQAISPHEAVAQPLTERSPDCASDVSEHLEKFGDSPAARRRSQEGRKRWRESVKAVAPRQHVVHTRPSTPDDHQPRDVDRPAAFNRYVDEWRPQYPVSMSMDKALREMEFPSRLAGASWVVDG